MRRSLLCVVGLFLCASFQPACTFYTNCPPCADDGNKTGGTGGSGGSSGSAGIGGAVPSGEWVNVTSNLASLASECGNLGFVSSKPDEDLLIAGIALQGLWVSTDGGENWDPIGQGEGSAEIVNRPTSIVYDPDYSETFWEAGIYNSGGIYQTTDDGDTFSQVGDLTHTDMVAIDFSDPDRMTMLAGRHETTERLYLSTDAGSTWDDIGPNLPSGGKYPSFPGIIDAETFLVGSSGFVDGTAGILRSTDRGETWDQVSTLGAQLEPLFASDGSLYWSIEAGGGLVKSTDQGQEWETVLGSGIGPTVRPSELDDGTIVTASARNIIASTDGGTSWKIVSPELPYLPAGVTYSAFQKAFFIWRQTCDGSVASDGIMKYEYDFGAE